MPPTSEPGVVKAMEAKQRLEALGWVATARKQHGDIIFLATRGEELLTIMWGSATGNIISQTYSLWGKVDARTMRHVTSVGHSLNQLEDDELIRSLVGRKVTWWNSLGAFEADAVIDPGKVQIEHAYNEKGIETPNDRILKFIDRSKGAFMAIRVSAITKVS
jgi:hypothetical protein